MFYSGHEPFGFKALQPLDVYIGMDAAPADRPDWIKNYEVTGLLIETDAEAGAKLQVYRKRYQPGEVVGFNGGVGKQMYTVAVLPVTQMEPATDLRPSISYKMDAAAIAGNGVVRDTLGGRRTAHFTQNNSGSVSFAVSPGVADLYALRIKYYNFTDKTLTGKMQLIAADGTVMKEEDISFKPVAKNKSGTISTNTGTSINAGNYKVVITGLQAAGLSITSVEMQ